MSNHNEQDNYEMPEILWSDDEVAADPEKIGPIQNLPILDDLDIEFTTNTLGERFLEKYKVLRDAANCCYLYNGKYWQEVTEVALRALALNIDTKKSTNSTRRKATVDYALDSCTLLDVRWNRISAEEIAFSDGIINVLTGEKYPHSWENYLTGVIPHEYKPEAKCPLWLKCLDDWFETEDKKLALQEFFGYILCLHAKYKKCLMLIGESNTGKSVPCYIAKEIVGFQAVSSVGLESMDDPAKAAPLKGKMLNLVTETSADAEIADGGFKKVTSNEPIQVNQKWVRSETIIPVAKHVIATNNMPRIGDVTEAVWNRILLIQFNHVVEKNKKDVYLEEKLKQEIDGIIAWSVEGAKRLILNRGEFTPVEESKKLLKEYKIYQNPILAYIEMSGEIEIDPKGSIPTQTFVKKFNAWNGGREYTANSIGRNISKIKLSNGETIKSVPCKNMRHYKGIKLAAHMTQISQAESNINNELIKNKID